MLEIGTGTGRFFVEALRRGADIYGLDCSQSMIERLRAKIPAEQYGRLSVQNAVTMSLPHRFSLVVAPFRMFSHVISVPDQIECLNRVWEHLEPGGRFIFDLYVPNLSLLLNGIDGKTDFEGEYEEGMRLRRTTSMKADLVNQISHVRMVFSWNEGGSKREAAWEFDMRFFFRWEIEHLIRLSKLKLETIYGDYDRSPLSSTSKDFLVVCRKS